MAFIITPIIGDGQTEDTPFRPKYVMELNVSWVSVGSFHDSWTVVKADLTPAQEATLLANPDVVVISNLDTAVDTQDLRDRLTAIGIPLHFLTGVSSVRQGLLRLARIALLAQRFRGVGGISRIFHNSVVDQTLAQIPLAERNRLRQASNFFGVDVQNLTGTTLRERLITFADTITHRIQLNGEII